MKYEGSVFVITYGVRLNTIARRIKLHSYLRIKRTRYQQGGQIQFSTNPWYGSDEIAPRSYAKNLVLLFIKDILKPDIKSRVIGFKEIRYDLQEFAKDEYMIEYLYFLKEFFPNAKFIFNERNIYDISKSGWWKEDAKALKKIESILSRMQVSYAEFKDIL